MDPKYQNIEQYIEQGLIASGLPLPSLADASYALARLVELVSAWSPRMNLTGHKTPKAIVDHLIFGALGLATVLPPLQSLVDLGSGAGFPGFPLALLRPEMKISLVEAREKRHHFQRAVKRELGLTQVQLLHGRAEELVPDLHEGVLAQAMAPPEVAVVWMARWAQNPGWLFIPQGKEGKSFPLPPGVCHSGWTIYKIPLINQYVKMWSGKTEKASREMG